MPLSIRTPIRALALAVALACACSKPRPLETRPIEEGASTRIPTEPNHPSRVAELERRGVPTSAEILFVGDSITEGWETAGREVWRRTWGSDRAANYGVSGDQTQHVLWRIARGHFDGISPRVVVLMIGTNNTGRGASPNETADGVAAILLRLRRKLPNAQILLLAIFPRGEKPDNPLRVKNERVNAILATFADGEHIHYLDIGSVFLSPDGSLSRDVMPDALHLSERGYELWAQAITPQIEALSRLSLRASTRQSDGAPGPGPRDFQSLTK